MRVDPAAAPHRHAYRGRDYFFCSTDCRDKFAADPEKYLHGTAIAAPQNAHPDGHDLHLPDASAKSAKLGPGHCPICGMALEPEAGGAAEDSERADMTRRLWISAALALPVVVAGNGRPFRPLAFFRQFAGLCRNSFSRRRSCCGAAGRSFVRGAQSLVTRNLNMFTLIAMGTGVAYLYSVVAVLAPGLFPADFRDAHGGIALYFEAAAVITVLVLLGQVLELSARASTSGAIRALIGLAPQNARRLRR